MKHCRLRDRSFWGFKYAFKGIWRTICTESHFRFHISAAVGTSMFTEYFELSRTDYMFLGLAIVLVLASELVNTALENTVDLCTAEYRPKAETAKDASAGFVLVCALFAILVAAMLFLKENLLASLMDIFTRPKYILYFVLTIIFVRGGFLHIDKEKRNGK